MKKRDILIIVCILLAAGGLYLFSQLSLGGQMRDVVVTVDGRETLRRPLAVNGSYEIRQDDGSVNVVTVENGAVFMQEANCRDGLCIRQGKMKNGAKTIVCLPHKVVVSLSDEAAADVADGLDVIIQ